MCHICTCITGVDSKAVANPANSLTHHSEPSNDSLPGSPESTPVDWDAACRAGIAFVGGLVLLTTALAMQFGWIYWRLHVIGVTLLSAAGTWPKTLRFVQLCRFVPAAAIAVGLSVLVLAARELR
jgi:hypothetical protein